MDKVSFEELIKELDQVVKDLENKDISIDDAMVKYQRGMEISRLCHEMLKKAESLLVKEAE